MIFSFLFFKKHTHTLSLSLSPSPSYILIRKMSTKPGVTAKNPDRQERHSASGRKDEGPRKEGHAGWGKSAEHAQPGLDPKDPNYQSDEEEPAPPVKE